MYPLWYGNVAQSGPSASRHPIVVNVVRDMRRIQHPTITRFTVGRHPRALRLDAGHS